MKKVMLTLLILIGTLFLLSAKDILIIVVDRDLEIPLEGVRIIDPESDSAFFTDENGKATIPVIEDRNRTVIIVELIGYESRKILIKETNETLLVEMLMEGIIEGQELVVEEEAIGETDEEVGVSIVIDKDMIQSAAKIGVIEDVMSAIKILPGVIYGGGFGSGISVRGGTVDGLTTVLDGFVVKNPYHWGGAFSIFNPNIIESVKFSPGIFSSKFGQATSALMEVNTVKPNEGFKMEAIISTSTIEFFTQIPITADNKAGFFGGFRLTNYDFILGVMNFVADVANDQNLKNTLTPITRSPYIYDFYLKAFYRPSDRFEWYINGFFGNDGIGINTETDAVADTIATDFNMDYFNNDFFVSTNMKILATDNFLIHFLAGYEYWIQKADATISESGTKFYSSDFIDFITALDPLYTTVTGNLIMPATFTIDTDSGFLSNIVNSGIQGRFDFDWSLTNNILFQFGLGTTLDITSLENLGDFWSVEMSGGVPTYTKKTFDLDVNETKSLNSFAYINFDMDIIPDILAMDIGVRIDHSYYMGADNFTLNTYPIPGPRLNLTYSPETEGLFFMDNSFSVGAGLFSKTPFDSIVIDKELGLNDFELAPPKTFMAVLGWDTHLPLDFHFKIEGYYKYIFDRSYQNSIIENSLLKSLILTDGIGHVAGGDLLIERKTSRYIDGMLSYSFVYAKYFNPALGTDEFPAPGDTDPRGEWYYPAFHRFNSLNLFLDIKPTGWLTFTTKMSFATGTPKSDWDEDKEMFWAAIENANGDIEMAEMYNRGSRYSDVLRMNWVLDLDLKISFHNYAANSKVEWEIYIAAENILAPLMAAILPNDSVDLDKWNGEEKVTPSAGLNFPIPSLGFKISY